MARGCGPGQAHSQFSEVQKLPGWHSYSHLVLQLQGLADSGPGDVFTVIYTSGTTGNLSCWIEIITTEGDMAARAKGTQGSNI